jgi:hypothetical protein
MDTPTKRPSSKGPAAKGPATKGPATKGPGHERSGWKRSGKKIRVQKVRIPYFHKGGTLTINPTYPRIMATLLKKHNYFELIFTLLTSM